MGSTDNTATVHQVMQGSASGAMYSESAIAQLGRQQGRVLRLLLKGQKLSGGEIARALGMSDPRGHIRDLRRKGYPISDMWVTTSYGTRYKLFFIRKA
ncbi:MAG: hypothetical protein J6U93_05125 [Alistipes sp.]|nr:hypothetical protein [Alistipes sp.]